MKLRNLILENLTDPKCEPVSDYNKTNAWIGPNGDYYGFEGAKHVIAATYISVYILNKDKSVLKKDGKFFKDSFDSYLLRNGWLEIKDISWLAGGDIKPQLFNRKSLTQKQMDSLFSYCESFGIDYQKLTNKE